MIDVLRRRDSRSGKNCDDFLRLFDEFLKPAFANNTSFDQQLKPVNSFVGFLESYADF